MTIRNVAWTILATAILAVATIGAFVYWALPRIEAAAAAGLTGILVGGLIGMFGSSLTAIVGAWKASKEAEEKFKDRISSHALQLTQMDYELRQKSLELTGQAQQFLAPAKVYRTFYRALLELHTSGDWPKEVEQLGLLNIFVLGGTAKPNQ